MSGQWSCAAGGVVPKDVRADSHKTCVYHTHHVESAIYNISRKSWDREIIYKSS